MTIFEALNWGKEQLKETSGEKRVMQANPMFDTQILLSNCLNKQTSYLFANSQEELSNEHINCFLRFVERRKRHEPISHILQYKEFYGLLFYVNQFVLTPRPETEILVDEALKDITPKSTIIDVGTGSGAIAITLATKTKQPVIAIDIDNKALQVAKLNAKQYKVDQIISFLQGSLLEPYLQKNITEAPDSNTIILANLPYLTTAQWEYSDPDVKNYEPKHALVGGLDGLDLYDKLLTQIQNARKKFSANLELIFEIDPSQTLKVKKLISNIFPSAKIEIIKDLSNADRFVKTTNI